MAPAGPECQNLGTVVGTGGGSFGGGWISNDQLSQYAINDALNKASAKGANYLQLTALQLAGNPATTATDVGIAFKCPSQDIPKTDGGVPAPVHKS
jgi:hypothetical protein